MVLKENCQVNQLSLVFIGDFNPVIVQPYWLASKGLIRETEGEQAVIDLIHGDLARFSIGWADFQVTRERFEIKTTQEAYFDAIKDLASEIFKLLTGTPIRSFGINHLRHYTLASPEQYYALGNTLAPLKNWSELFEDPRLLSIEIVTDKKKEGAKRIRIQPSDFEKLKGKNAFMMNLNDHYQFAGNTHLAGAKPIDILNENWSKSIDFANEAELQVQKMIK